MKFKKTLALLTALCLCLGSFTACDEETQESTAPTTAESETQPTQPPVEIKDYISVGTGIITGQFNPAYATEEGDKLIASLIMPGILSYDRSGRVLLDASAEKSETFGGRLFTYKTLADIDVTYLTEADLVTPTEPASEETVPAQSEEPETSAAQTDTQTTAAEETTQATEATEAATSEPAENTQAAEATEAAQAPDNTKIKKTAYDITLGDVKFQDGTAITADDLIFTYYVLCDLSYSGNYKLNESDIEGLSAYQHNNTKAPEVYVSSEDVSNALAQPSDDLKAVINSDIIKPVLSEGREFCELNWQKYVDRGYGNSAEELFVMLFTQALQSDYAADNKDFDTIFNDTLALFGMNYKSLARIWFGRAEDLDDEVNTLIKNRIYEQRLADLGGQPVSSISGIIKTGDKSVRIVVDGKGGDSTLAMIADIPVLSLHYYGNGSDYNYDGANFGVTRGDVSAVKSHSSEPFGYGPYMFDNMENLVVSLKPNTEFCLGDAPANNLKLCNIAEADRIGNIEAGNIDVAMVKFNAEEIDLIKEANKGEINGSTLSTVLLSDDSYEYFGLNTAALNLGEDAGLSLRTALCKLLASVRIDKSRAEYGDNYETVLIQYPGSASYWGTPKSDDESYKIAYATENTGEDFKNELRELFKGAGYEFDDEGRVKPVTEVSVTKEVKEKRKTKTVTVTENKNWKTTFSIAIPLYLIEDHIMMAVFEEAQSILDSIGFTLEPKYFDQTDEFILALQSGQYDIWMAERSTVSFNPGSYYSSSGKYNYYGIKNEQLDSLINTAASSAPETQERDTKSVYYAVMDQSIEVPVYQKQHAVVYSSERTTIEDLAFTEYYGVFDSINAIKLK